MGKSSGGPPPNYTGGYYDKDGNQLDPERVARGLEPDDVMAGSTYRPGSVERQEQSSRDAIGAQTQANRPNINSNWGGQNWTQGADGSWQMHNTLNPALQGAADGYMSQFRQGVANPVDDGSAARQQTTQAAWNQARSRLDPMFKQRETSMNSDLLNRGLDTGSEANRTEQGNFSRERNDTYQGAMNNAAGLGAAAQNSVFGQNMEARALPMQQMQGLYSFGGTPQFNGAGAWQPEQYVNADRYAYDAANGRADINNRQTADMVKGWSGAVGGMIKGGAGG